MGQELGPKPFFDHRDKLISRYLEQWSEGYLFAAMVGDQINTSVASGDDSLIGRVITLPVNDISSIRTYVIHEVQRDQGAVGVGEGVGQFIAFQACMLMVDWARHIDDLNDFFLAFQAPSGYPWTGLVDLMGFSQTVSVPLGRGVIKMPGRRYS